MNKLENIAYGVNITAVEYQLFTAIHEYLLFVLRGAHPVLLDCVSKLYKPHILMQV